MNICGDFLQLPPVDKDGSKKSLAMPHEESPVSEDDKDVATPAEAKKEMESKLLEGRQGFQLWREIKRV
eukprot:5479591-Karenia_brevis.AAC.1